MLAPPNNIAQVDEDTDIWIMDSDRVWMKVLEGVGPDSLILYAPANIPKCTATEMEVVVEAAVA